MSQPNNGSPAPYGRSCEECSRSKTKCILQPGSSRCERCHRLRRECRPSPSKRRRTSDRRNTSKTSRIDEAVSRTAQLEEKFDQLVASLQPRTTVDASSTASNASLHANGIAPGSSSSTSNVPGRSPWTNSSGTYAEEWKSESAEFNLWHAANITIASAEEALATFKNNYLKWFPFVYIPLEMTAQQLYTEKPILWLSIMTNCSKPASVRWRLDELFRQRLGEEMVVKSEKSIDLLLGLLCFIGWYHIHCHLPNGAIRLSLSLLTQMAISLVFDLKKPVYTQPDELMNQHLQKPMRCRNLRFDSPRKIEERRAFLGCFLVTSVVSSHLQRMDPLRWSSHLEDCLLELDKNQEWPGDELLVHMVKMQLVIEKATLHHWYGTVMEPTDHARTPPTFYVQALRAQLKEVWATFPPRSQEAPLLRLHFHSIELAVTELALSSTLSAAPQRAHLGVHQQKLRFDCLNSIKVWFEIFFSSPAADYLRFSFTIASEAVRSLGTLFYLCTLNEPGWSRETVRAELDPLWVLDKTIATMEAAITELGLEDDDLLAKHCQLYKAMRPSWVAKLSESGEVPNSQEVSQATAAVPAAQMELDDMTLGSELFDLNFFDSELLLGWPAVGGF